MPRRHAPNDAPEEPLLLDLAPPAPPARDPFAPAGAPADDLAGPVATVA